MLLTIKKSFYGLGLLLFSLECMAHVSSEHKTILDALQHEFLSLNIIILGAIFLAGFGLWLGVKKIHKAKLINKK